MLGLLRGTCWLLETKCCSPSPRRVSQLCSVLLLLLLPRPPLLLLVQLVLLLLLQLGL